MAVRTVLPRFDPCRLARIGKEYKAKFKLLATGNDFDAAMPPTSRRAGSRNCASKPFAAAD